MKTHQTFYLIVVLTILSSCKSSVQDETENIKALLKQEQTAHLTENVDLFLSGFMDGMIAVNRGEVSQPTYVETRERFTNYFSNVEFVKWEDTAEPIIRFSDDNSLAYAILQKQVIVIPSGSTLPDTTDFAWISIYRKVDGEWKGECNVSTNKPK